MLGVDVIFHWGNYVGIAECWKMIYTDECKKSIQKSIKMVRLSLMNIGNHYGRVLKRNCQHGRELKINTDVYCKR